MWIGRSVPTRFQGFAPFGVFLPHLKLNISSCFLSILLLAWPLLCFWMCNQKINKNIVDNVCFILPSPEPIAVIGELDCIETLLRIIQEYDILSRK